MEQGSFIWTDLSTYRVRRARQDYAKLFDWSFQGPDRYKYATINSEPVAAVFKMPRRLAKMSMPSFWMSYIKVDDLDGAVEQARRHDNVIIEVEPQPFDQEARVALVRDPSGAGFTLYEGPDIATTRHQSISGAVVGRYHHVANISRIKTFYEDMFAWEFRKTSDTQWPVFDIYRPNGNAIATVEEVPETIRGKFNYWMPCFSTSGLESFKSILSRINGIVLHDLGEGRLMVADRQQAHFMVQSKRVETD